MEWLEISLSTSSEAAEAVAEVLSRFAPQGVVIEAGPEGIGSGEVTVLKAGPEYTVLGQSTLPERTDATPAIANGRMYIRTLNHLICVGNAKAKT